MQVIVSTLLGTGRSIWSCNHLTIPDPWKLSSGLLLLPLPRVSPKLCKVNLSWWCDGILHTKKHSSHNNVLVLGGGWTHIRSSREQLYGMWFVPRFQNSECMQIGVKINFLLLEKSLCSLSRSAVTSNLPNFSFGSYLQGPILHVGRFELWCPVILLYIKVSILSIITHRLPFPLCYRVVTKISTYFRCPAP